MQITNVKTGNTIPVYLQMPKVKYDCFDRFDYRTWFRKNCTDDIYIGAQYMYFKNEKDAILFSLKFR